MDRLLTKMNPCSSKSSCQQPINISRNSARSLLVGQRSFDPDKEDEWLRRKTIITRTGSYAEREADRVADQIVAMKPHSAGSPPMTAITGKGAEPSTGEALAPPSVTGILKETGKPLSPDLKQDMEQRFGHDFSGVRVHLGTAAARSAREVNAKAYTVNHNIVFGSGQYAPQSAAGRHLIAHELTHVIQSHKGDSAYSAASYQSGSQNLLQREETGGDVDVDSVAEITLETGNVGAGFLNNLVHQQICIEGSEVQQNKRCFSFAAVGAQLPQFSTTWLGWDSLVVGAILKGQVYEPAPVSDATIVNRHRPTAEQGARWLNYIESRRLGLNDGYSVARHNCRTYSQWEFRDAPGNW